MLVNPGSIYHALKTLTRDGFLRVAQTGRRGARPERTAYELTTDGETEFVTAFVSRQVSIAPSSGRAPDRGPRTALTTSGYRA
ncbi:MAG TPA: PadR family transcriptional regulator [Pseudonocardiaceae bacterium]|nr:PadR family transcriptional regulator [Pseudonocardiaceae bacterium]